MVEPGRGAPSLHAGFFAFRVPALPFGVLTDWADGVRAPACSPADLDGALAHDRLLLRERLMEIVRQPEPMAALSLASPDLVESLRERDSDAGVEAALVRYVSRMASRATPFGLFAACGAGEIADRTQISLPAAGAWFRHTRLDGDYLDRIVRARVGELRPSLSFRPSDSLYLIGGRQRYVQVRFDGLERTHHLAELRDSPHLRRALEAAEPGALPAEIADAVAAAGVAADAAARYVEELIDAQVLVPSLAVTVTGPPALDALIADLDAAGDAAAVAILTGVRDELDALDADGAVAAPERAEHVTALLGEIAVAESRARVLQVDMTVPDCDATLARSTVEDVARAVALLCRISPRREPSELDRFRDAFVERYEGREVPLLEALDDDLGAGYGSGQADGQLAPLLDGLALPRPERRAPAGRRERRLLELLHRSCIDGLHEVVLDADDIAALERDDPPGLPDGASAVAILADTDQGLRVLVSSVDGSTGVSLLGRFCQADPVLDAHVRAQLRAEEALRPEAIHAEIVHLPSGRMTNVVARPVLREWELEWRGRSGAPPERRLPASDLVVSVRAGRFVLRSRRLDRRVLPRLTSAHNWRRRSPAVYRFLAALRTEGTPDPLGWSWAPLDRSPFTPRVRWGRVILARAAWWATKGELRELDQRDPVIRWSAVQGWRARRRLPRWVCLVDDDNGLTIDLDNTLSVDTFVRATRGREEAKLEELFPAPDELIADGPDGRRALELVIPFVRSPPVPAAQGSQADRATPPAERLVPASANVPRTFAPGSEWTYLKLYTGPATADTLLHDAIAPLVRTLTDGGTLDQWFFIRYRDPRFHLRVRFHGPPSAILEPVQQLAAQALEDGLAHDAQIGTYEREIERYGGPQAITIAERLFHADADAVVALLGMFERGERGLDERWRIGVLGCEALMAGLGLDDDERTAQVSRIHAGFEEELNADQRLRKAVAHRVRTEHAAIETLLSATRDGDHPLAAGIAVIAERSRRIEPLAAELQALRTAGRLRVPLDALAAIHVHMSLNRLCRSQNRFHEYVTYALLASVLKARSARALAQRRN